jgi:uncharacterized membrane protein
MIDSGIFMSVVLTVLFWVGVLCLLGGNKMNIYQREIRFAQKIDQRRRRARGAMLQVREFLSGLIVIPGKLFCLLVKFTYTRIGLIIQTLRRSPSHPPVS